MAAIPPILQGLSNSLDHAAMQMADDLIQKELIKDYGNTLGFLVSAFANESYPEALRWQLGIYIKNIISADDPQIKKEKRDRWEASSVEHRNIIKQIFLQVLSSPVQRISSVAAQVIGAFAAIDISAVPNRWPELINSLLSNIADSNAGIHVIANSLQAIGYTCECDEVGESDTCFSPEEVNQMLTMVIGSLGADRPPAIQSAALDALSNAIAFTEDNFKRDAERDVIVNSVLSLLASSNKDVRVKAYECMCQIIQYFYSYIDKYSQNIFNITGLCITTEADTELVKYALQLWITIGDCEQAIIDDLEALDIDVSKYDNSEDIIYHHLIEKTADIFIPILLTQLSRVDIDDEENEDSVGQSAQDLLTYYQFINYASFATHSGVFIQKFITSPKLEDTYSCLTALGLLANPAQPALSYHSLASAFHILAQGMKTNQSIIKAQSAWSIGQLLRLYDPSYFSPEILQKCLSSLIEVLQGTLQCDAHVLKSVCRALQELFLCHCFQQDKDESISLYVEPFMRAFYAATKRPDCVRENLFPTIFEVISSLITATPRKQIQVIVETLRLSIASLHESMALVNQSESNYQSHIIGTISECCKEIMLCDPNILTQPGPNGCIADSTMAILIGIMGSSTHTYVHDECLLAIGYVAQALGSQFQKYCAGTQLIQMMGAALSKYNDDHMLAIVALGTIGDVFKSISTNLTSEICDPFMSLVSTILMSQSVMREVKPHAVAFCGEMCLAQPDLFFSRYVAPVIDILQKAIDSATLSGDSDESFVEYITELRENILYVFSAIFDELNVRNLPDLIEQQCPLIFTLIVRISNDSVTLNSTFGDEIFFEETKEAVAMVGDVARFLKHRAVNFVFHEKVTALVDRFSELARASPGDETLAKTAKYVSDYRNACR